MMSRNRVLGGRPARFLRALAFGAALLVVSLLAWDAGSATGPLADTPWPVYGQNALHNNRSPYVGPTEMPGLKWRFNRITDHWGTDYRGTGIGLDSTVYLSAGMTGVYAIDSSTGQMKWLFSPENTGHETWVEFPPTVAADGTLYVTSENDYIYALDSGGHVLWKFLSYHLHTPVSISPDGTTVHFVSESGYAYALNRTNGSLKWRYRLGYGSYGTGLRIPVVYDAQGNLYFAWIQKVWSLDPSGNLRWMRIVPGVRRLAGPAVDNDLMYFSDTTGVVAVGMDGAIKWQYPISGNPFLRTPTVGPDGTIYIGADDGFVYALNPVGSLKWKQQYVLAAGWASGVKSNIIMDALGTLYFYGKDGYVYAVSSQTRQVLWRYNSGQNDMSYPGQQPSLDADGTLYVPVDEGLMLALSPASGPPPPPPPPSTNTPVPPTATSTSTPVPPPSGNVLSNVGFEEDANGDAVPDNWQVSSSGAGLVSRSDKQYYEGSFSLLARSTQGASFVVYQDVLVNPGESYSFSGKMNVPAAWGWFRASIQLLALASDGRALVTATARSQTSITAGWAPAQTSMLVPPGATSLRVHLRLEYLRADVYVDGFSLTRTK